MAIRATMITTTTMERGLLVLAPMVREVAVADEDAMATAVVDAAVTDLEDGVALALIMEDPATTAIAALLASRSSHLMTALAVVLTATDLVATTIPVDLADARPGAGIPSQGAATTREQTSTPPTCSAHSTMHL